MKQIKKIKIFLIIMMLCTWISVSGCKSKIADIFVTIYPIEFLTKTIVGDKMVVESVYPLGTDVHEYDPPLKTVLGMSDSEAIIYLGAGLEAFMENAVTSTLKNNRLLELSDYIDMIDPSVSNKNNTEDPLGDKAHTVDPHAWLDPLRMVTFAEEILKLVVELRPEEEQFFTKNAHTLIEELKAIDNEYKTALNDPAIISKIMLVDHNAYLYWQYCYGIEIIKTRLDNDSAEIIASEYIKNLEIIRNNNIKYIVTTAHENRSGAVDRYIRDANLQEIQLHHLSSLTNSECDNGEDYISIMRSNLAVLLLVMPKN